jgi:hypothetical protein
VTFEYTRIPVKVRDWQDSHRRNSQAINYLLALSGTSDFNSPLTTEGDIMGHDGSSEFRFPIGTNNQVLTVATGTSGKLAWTTPYSDPLTNKGDVLTRTAGSTVRLAVGADGHVLTADSASGQGIKWAAPAGATPLTTKGDVLAHDGTTDVRVPVGTNGQYLQADSTVAAGVKWATPGGGTSPLSTKGDLWGYDTADNRIPIGTDGQVLTADSAQALGLKWATPSGGGGGGWTYFEELSLASGASVTSSTLPAFTDILIVGNDVNPTGSSKKLQITPSGTYTWYGAGYNHAGTNTTFTSVSAITTHSSSTARELWCQLKKWGNSRDWWSIRGHFSDTTVNNHAMEGLMKLTAGSFTTLKFQWNSGNLNGGTVQIFYR